MTVDAFVALLWRQRLLVLLLSVVGGALGFGSSLIIPKVYVATATSFVTAKPTSDKAASYESAQFAVSRAKSYTPLLESPEVLSGVIDELKLNLTVADLAQQLKAENPTDTLLINVTAEADSPDLAKRIADSASRHLATEIEALETGGNNQRTSPVDIQLAVPAPTPNGPDTPQPMVNTLLGALLGFALSAMAALYLAARRQRRSAASRPQQDEHWWQSARHVRGEAAGKDGDHDEPATEGRTGAAAPGATPGATPGAAAAPRRDPHGPPTGSLGLPSVGIDGDPARGIPTTGPRAPRPVIRPDEPMPRPAATVQRDPLPRPADPPPRPAAYTRRPAESPQRPAASDARPGAPAWRPTDPSGQSAQPAQPAPRPAEARPATSSPSSAPRIPEWVKRPPAASPSEPPSPPQRPITFGPGASGEQALPVTEPINTVKGEPTKGEPTKGEPTKGEPVKAEPEADAVKSEPAKSQVKSEPIKKLLADAIKKPVIDPATRQIPLPVQEEAASVNGDRDDEKEAPATAEREQTEKQPQP